MKGTSIGGIEQDTEAMSIDATSPVDCRWVPAMQGQEPCPPRDSWNNVEPSHISVFSNQIGTRDEIVELKQALHQKSCHFLQLQSDFCRDKAEIEKQRKAAESKNIFCREELREMTERAKSLSEQVRKSNKKAGELQVARQHAEEYQARFVREDAACKALKIERDGLQLELHDSRTEAQAALRESAEWREAMTKGELPQQQENEIRLAAEEAKEVMMIKHCDELDDLTRRHELERRELQQDVIELRSECTRLKSEDAAAAAGPIHNLRTHFEDHITMLKRELVDQLADLHGQQQEQRGQDEKELDELRKSLEGCKVALAASQEDFTMLARLFEKERWEHKQLRDSLAEFSHAEVSCEATQRWTATLATEHNVDNPSCSSISVRPVETAGSSGSGSTMRSVAPDAQLADLQALVSSPCFPGGSYSPGATAAAAVHGRMVGVGECNSAGDLSASLSSSAASATHVRSHGGAAAAYSRRRPSTGIMSTI